MRVLVPQATNVTKIIGKAGSNAGVLINRNIF